MLAVYKGALLCLSPSSSRLASQVAIRRVLPDVRKTRWRLRLPKPPRLFALVGTSFWPAKLLSANSARRVVGGDWHGWGHVSAGDKGQRWMDQFKQWLNTILNR